MDGVRVAWDYSSMRQLASVGYYPRIKSLRNAKLAAVYEGPEGACIKESGDGGATWSDARTVIPSFRFTNPNEATVRINIANSELVELRDGTMIYGVNYRPATDGIAPYSIAISRSTDGGITWSAPQVLYDADLYFGNGCWEPAFLELPDGTVQVYFANENPYRNSGEQEIAMLSSKDSGITWTTQPATVCFRANRRDGMPVPAIFGDEIVVVIEDNNIDQFKPYTVRTKISDNWSSGPVTADSPAREYALKERLDDNIYAGAPYLIKIPGGSMISFQSTKGRTSDWERATTLVAIGDGQARNFSQLTTPFVVSHTQLAMWGSLCLIDEHTVVAAVASTMGGSSAPWMIKGYLIPDLVAERRPVTVDGEVEQQEWGDYLPVFVGHRSKTNLRAAIASGNGYLYLCASVNDNNIMAADGVDFYIDAKNSCYTTPHEGVYRINCTASQKFSTYVGKEGEWVEQPLSGVDCVVKTDEAGGKYTIEIALPLAALDNAAMETMRFALSLTDNNGEGSTYSEAIAGTDTATPYTWCKLIL
jgi:hypothetical protein